MKKNFFTGNKKFYFLSLFAVLFSLSTAFSAGQEYYLTFHPGAGYAEGEIRVIAFSAVSSEIFLEIGSKEILYSKVCGAGSSVEFVLNPEDVMCFNNNPEEYPDSYQVYENAAVRLYSDDPFVCYALYDSPNHADGINVMPVSELGKEYCVSAWHDKTGDSRHSPSYASIVGVYDNTLVNFTLGGTETTFVPGGEEDLKPGETASRLLNKGDVLLFPAIGPDGDVTGSTIDANKPVAVFSGNYGNYSPGDGGADYTISQNTPRESWGRTYHIPAAANMTKQSAVRCMVGKENTTIYKDAHDWNTVQTVGGMKDVGWISEILNEEETGDVKPTTLLAEAPLSVTQYYPGKSETEPGNYFSQTRLKSLQYYDTFVTTSSMGYEKEYVAFTYYATDKGQLLPDYMFGLLIDGEIQWQRLAVITKDYGVEYPNYPVAGSRHWKQVTIELPDEPGPFFFKGKDPFSAVQYGISENKAYAFPLSGAEPDFDNSEDIYAPTVEYESHCDGLFFGTATEEPRDDDNIRSNFGEVRLLQDSSYNYELMVSGEIIQGQTNEIEWELQPIDIHTYGYAKILFIDRAGNATIDTFRYHPIKINTTPLRIREHIDPVSATPRFKISVKNNSSAPVRISDVFLLGDDEERDWDESGWRLSNISGVMLPTEVPAYGELEFLASFDSEKVDEQIYDGQTKFIDSLGIEAGWCETCQEACLTRYISHLEAIVNPSSVEEPDSTFKVKIFPNPVGDLLKVTTESRTFEIDVYDFNGKHILKSESQNINVSQLATGTYYILLKEKGKTKRLRFVKK